MATHAPPKEGGTCFPTLLIPSWVKFEWIFINVFIEMNIRGVVDHESPGIDSLVADLEVLDEVPSDISHVIREAHGLANNLLQLGHFFFPH